MSTLCASGTESPAKAEDEQKLQVAQNGSAAKPLSARGTVLSPTPGQEGKQDGGEDNRAFVSHEIAHQPIQVNGSTSIFSFFFY